MILSIKKMQHAKTICQTGCNLEKFYLFDLNGEVSYISHKLGDSIFVCQPGVVFEGAQQGPVRLQTLIELSQTVLLMEEREKNKLVIVSAFRLSKHDDSSLSKNAYQSDVF